MSGEADRDKELEATMGLLQPRWDAARMETALSGLERRQRQRRNQKLAVVAVAASLLLAVLLGLVGRRALENARQQQQPAIAKKTPKSIEFEDGSRASPLSQDSQVVVSQVSPDQTRVKVVRGGARFVVSKQKDRTFEVEAGTIVVTVIGTVFKVHNHGEKGVRVEVEEGRVGVSSNGGGYWELSADEEATFPNEPPEPQAEPDMEMAALDMGQAQPDMKPAQAKAEAPKPRKKTRKPRRDRNKWKKLARRGDYERASKALLDPGARVGNSVSDLLLAADTMRLSGNPDKAVEHLDRVLKKNRRDRRAAVAAFTKGRVLMRQLGRPKSAARAFALVQKLQPSKSLAEDALAREVEAWWRAGDKKRARSRAEAYIASYPKGHRAEIVKRYGGLP